MSEKSLKEMRKKLGATTDQLAYRLGVAQSTVVRLEQSEERGSITLNKLREAAEALGCEVSYEIRLKADSPSQKKGEKKGEKKRPAKTADGRDYSFAAAGHKEQDIAIAQQMSPTDRLKRALELSDFVRKLQTCSK